MSAPMITSAPTQSPARSPRLRLTRRGRVVFGALGTLLLAGALALAALLGAPQAQASSDAGGEDFGYVIVTPGASLWSVATEIDPASDPRDLVAEIVRLNQLEDSGVEAGQPLAVPTRYLDAPGVVTASEL